MVSSHGRFVWYELTTTDMEAAKAFYAKVVGWGTRDASMPDLPYTVFTAGEAPVSGMMYLPEDARRMGERPSWIGYVCVDDVDATADRIGGLAAPCTSNRRISSTSAAFRSSPTRKWQRLRCSSGSNPAESSPPSCAHAGRVGWHELLADDWEKAWAFYSELFGWQKVAADVGAMGAYQQFSAGRADDRRHVHQTSDGAGSLLALLLQRRRHQRGGKAREGRQRPILSGPDWKCRAATGWSNARTLRAPSSRWWAATALDISSEPHRARKQAELGEAGPFAYPVAGPDPIAVIAARSR